MWKHVKPWWHGLHFKAAFSVYHMIASHQGAITPNVIRVICNISSVTLIILHTLFLIRGNIGSVLRQADFRVYQVSESHHGAHHVRCNSQRNISINLSLIVLWLISEERLIISATLPHQRRTTVPHQWRQAVPDNNFVAQWADTMSVLMALSIFWWPGNYLFLLNPCAAGVQFDHYTIMQKSLKMTETLAHGYSSESS